MSSELVADDLLPAASPGVQIERHANASSPVGGHSGHGKHALPPSKRARIAGNGHRDAFGFEVDDLENIEAEFEHIRRVSLAADCSITSRSSARPLIPDPHPQSLRSRTLSPAARNGRRQHKFVHKTLEFPQGQRWVESTGSVKRSASEARSSSAEIPAQEPDDGLELSLEKHKDQIAALIAKKRKDNEASRFRHKLARKQLAYLGVADPSEQTIAEAHQNLKRRMEASARGEHEMEEYESPLIANATPGHPVEGELQDLGDDDDGKVNGKGKQTDFVELEHTTPAQASQVMVIENTRSQRNSVEPVSEIGQPSVSQPASPEVNSSALQLASAPQQGQRPRPLLSSRMHHQAVVTDLIGTTSHTLSSATRAEIVQAPGYTFDVRDADHEAASNALLWTPDQHQPFLPAPDYSTLSSNNPEWHSWTTAHPSFTHPSQASHAAPDTDHPNQPPTTSPAALAALTIFGTTSYASDDSHPHNQTHPSTLSFFNPSNPIQHPLLLPRPPIVPSNMNMFSGQARESVFLGRNGLATPGEDEERHNMFRN